MKRLARLFRRTLDGPAEGSDAPPDDEPPVTERLTYAVGDIHGRDDLLGEMLGRIEEDADATPHDIVFLGDYIDRGPKSSDVLRRLMALDKSPPERARITCLMGNHDYMMLHFIAAPGDGASWLLAGGQDTLASFGIFGGPFGGVGGTVAERVASQADALAEALGPELTDWLANRPLWWKSGDLIAVHAYTEPTLEMESQDEETLLWARPPEVGVARSDGTWVVHGHTIVHEPSVRARHVNIDTGAFQGSGALTAGVFAPGAKPRFLAVASVP